MNYEWDQTKNLENIRKHKVSFEQAKIALEDPYRLCFYDEAHSLNEDRYIVIGSAERRTLFLSIVWVDEDTIRIISARRANRNEMEAYNETYALYFGKRTKPH
jgi:uncharacterized DUF497 family protein